MTSEGLGEMFEGDSADMCAEKFPLVSMVAERRVWRAQTRERGPHRRERKLNNNTDLPRQINNMPEGSKYISLKIDRNHTLR